MVVGGLLPLERASRRKSYTFLPVQGGIGALLHWLLAGSSARNRSEGIVDSHQEDKIFLRKSHLHTHYQVIREYPHTESA